MYSAIPSPYTFLLESKQYISPPTPSPPSVVEKRIRSSILKPSRWSLSPRLPPVVYGYGAGLGVRPTEE